MSKDSQYFGRFKLWVMKEHSISFWSMIKFILIFICQFLFFYLPLYIAIRLNIPKDTKFTFIQWWGPILVAVFMVFISYVWENYRDRIKNRTIERDKIIYDCIGGAIQELHEIKFSTPNDNMHYINEILVYIEKVIFAIFKSSGIPCGTLCVNLMTRENDELKLTKFATKFQDRDKPTLKIDEKNPLPGAPEAWVFKKVIYINDIQKDEYKTYFSSMYKFRSFISIPLMNSNDVLGIINVDSNLTDQFVSDDFISKKIMTKVNPLLLLFIFERELFNK